MLNRHKKCSDNLLAALQTVVHSFPSFVFRFSENSGFHYSLLRVTFYVHFIMSRACQIKGVSRRCYYSTEPLWRLSRTGGARSPGQCQRRYTEAFRDIKPQKNLYREEVRIPTLQNKLKYSQKLIVHTEELPKRLKT